MTPQTNDEPTIQNVLNTVQDVLSTVNAFSTHVDKRFDGVEGRLDKVEGRLDKVEGRLTKIESTMVTKDYLDEKLSDLKGDLVVLVRKEDRKLASLIDVLIRKSVISTDDAKHILALEPFPQS
jgi:hypothetical protein